MATQAKNGAKAPQKPAQRLPLKATVNWLNPHEDERIRASASFTIGGAFAVHGIKVVEGTKGTFVSMPSYKSGDGYKDIFHAVTKEARQQMNDAVMAAYDQKLEEAQGLGEEMDSPDEAQAGPAMRM